MKIQTTLFALALLFMGVLTVPQSASAQVAPTYTCPAGSTLVNGNQCQAPAYQPAAIAATATMPANTVTVQSAESLAVNPSGAVTVYAPPCPSPMYATSQVPIITGQSGITGQASCVATVNSPTTSFSCPTGSTERFVKYKQCNKGGRNLQCFIWTAGTCGLPLYLCPAGYTYSGSGPSTSCISPLVTPAPTAATPSCSAGYVLSGDTCVVTTGTITVSSNIMAGWTITGPATLPDAGTTKSYTSYPHGTYTITWGAVSGYTAPVSQSLTLTPNGIITFSGTYALTVTSCPSGQAYNAPTLSCISCTNGGCSGPGGTPASPNGGLACNNGGVNVPTCTAPPANCTTPWGSTVISGYQATGYSSATVTLPTVCTSVARTSTCTNGTLAPSLTSYPNQACTEASAACTTPWGTTIASGASVSAYQFIAVTSPKTCASISENRTCTNGTLSGSFVNENCKVQPTFNAF